MIKKPEIESVGDVYVLRWIEHKLKMKLNHIHETANSVWSEISISQNSGGSDQHIYQAKLNLLSANAKKTLASELSQRLNIDWQTILEQASVMTLREYRTGEATTRLNIRATRSKPRFRISPFVLNNELSAVYGYGGSGKSVFTILLALLVQCGVSLLGMEVQKGNSLILDWESSREMAEEVATAIKSGMGIECLELPFYRRCHRLLASEISEIQTQVLTNKIEFVIVDSAGMASGFGGDYHSPAVDMLRALRSLNVSVLIIDHKPKDSDTMFGSVYKTNECRATWEMRADQDEGSSILRLGLFHTKGNMTKRFAPWGLEIEFFGDENLTEKITFSKRDVTELSGIVERLSANTRILKLLASGALHPKEIIEQLQITETNTRTALSRLKSAKKIIQLEDGKYGLLEETNGDF